MMTVPEAAARAGKDAETIRRWIRSGRLRSTKIGTQYLVDENDLDAVSQPPRAEGMPPRWKTFDSGRAAPDWVQALRTSRAGH